MSRRFPWFELLLSLVFLSATLYAAASDAYNLPNRWFIRDDAYYYFKVAQNISEGKGSTFDGLHPTNGYHPLWLLICIPIFALARFDLILPLRVLATVTGVLQLSTAILLYRLLRSAVSTVAGILAAAFWAFSSYVLVFLYKTGVESNIALFLLVLLLNLLYRAETTERRSATGHLQTALLALLAALITFSRLDLIFVALAFGIWIVFRGHPLRYLLPLDSLALVVAAVAAHLVRLGFPAYYDVSDTVVSMLVLSLVVKIPIFHLLGLFRSPHEWKILPLLLRCLLVNLLGSVALGIVLWAGQALGLVPSVSRAVLVLDGGLSLALITAIRFAAYVLRPQPRSGPGAAGRSSSGTPRKEWLTLGLIYFGIVGGTLAAYMLWNQLAFGTLTPVSGQIKHWWGSFTHSIYGSSAGNWLTFFALNPFSEFNAWAPPTILLSDLSNQVLYREGTGFGNPRWRQNFAWVLLLTVLLLALVLGLKRRKSLRGAMQTAMIPLFVGSWLQILAYNVTGYASPKEWYWLTEPVLLVLVGALLVNAVVRFAFRNWAPAQVLVWILVAFYSGRGAFIYWRDAYYLSPYGLHPLGTPYSDVIPFLEGTTEPGAVIGMTGGGNVGYLMPSRTIVNMDGLINSNEYFQALQAGTAADYLYDTGMRYVFANPTLLDANPYRGQFAERLQLVVDWGGKDLLRLLPPSGH